MDVARLLILFILFSYAGYAQQTVFSIDNIPVSSDEFIYTFKKNHPVKATRNDIDEYLELYINFKLKVLEARSLGLDTLASYKAELSTYVGQLAQPYLTEKDVTNKLVKEAYQRMKEEVSVSHLLFLIAENATPRDTFEIYQNAQEIYQLTETENFKKLVISHSQEPGVSKTKGYLGYFTAFQMVYPFESAAYNTPPGSVSPPIRSKFGYHILKVHDRRPYSGEVQISHLMLRFNKSMTKQDSLEMKENIFGLYDLVLDNYNWEELIKNNSEDANSKDKGGILKPFSVGDMMPEIAEVAFKLDSIGQVSEPVLSPFGWHLIRLESTEGLKSFEDLKPEIEKMVNRDSRSDKSEEALIHRLKSENGFDENFEASSKIINSIIPPTKEIIDSLNHTSVLLFSIGDSVYTTSDFSRAITNLKGKIKGLNLHYKEYVSTSIIEYERKMLARKYPEYKHLIREYHEGILLFDVMNTLIWGPSSSDSTGLNVYFNDNLLEYEAKERVSISIFESSTSIDDEFMQFVNSIMIDSALVENKEQQILINFSEVNVSTSGFFDRGEISDEYFKDSGIYVLTGNRILIVWNYEDSRQLTLDEIKGRVIADYQKYLEETWIEELKAKYMVTVNKRGLKKVYKEIEK